jgi:hypothetical protein
MLLSLPNETKASRSSASYWRCKTCPLRSICCASFPWLA